MKTSAKEFSSVSLEAPPAKCIACGHSNTAGESSCQACGSSLDLKLCSSCEAINAIKAEHCHACGAKFAPPTGNRMMPVAMAHTIDAPRRRGPVLALAGVLLLAATVLMAYRYYGNELAPALQAMLAALNPPARPPAAEGAIRTEPALTTQAPVVRVPAKEEAPKVTPVKEVPKTAVKEAPKVTAATQPAEPRPATRVRNRAVAPAHAPSTVPTLRLGAAEPANENAAVVGVSVSSPPLSMPHPRVTHTKPMPNGASLPVASVVVSPPTGSNGCSEPAAALGLCARNEKGEGK